VLATGKTRKTPQATLQASAYSENDTGLIMLTCRLISASAIHTRSASGLVFEMSSPF